MPPPSAAAAGSAAWPSTLGTPALPTQPATAPPAANLPGVTPCDRHSSPAANLPSDTPERLSHHRDSDSRGTDSRTTKLSSGGQL
ncbi:MAG: hypothetical protein SNJ75_15970 [Gemmataceae bacterium]